jgi:predicted GNAT superfamily acetyltransferase
MDELLRSNGALVMVSKVGDVAVVGVVADWTGFSEQSFFDYSIESAIEEAVRACGECKREFDYLKG